MDEPLSRFLVFISILIVMAVLQTLFPRRPLRLGLHRWAGNFSLVAVNVMLVRLLLPAGAVGAALWAEKAHVGLRHWLHIGADGWQGAAAVFFAVVVLDLLIYAQHVLFHAVPVLWRLHRVHHADQDIDVSTGLRFHPIEILLSMLIKMAAVVVLGAPVAAVLIFEMLLNGMAMFNHSNVRLPLALDAVLRHLLVTPDMHRVHHSVLHAETNSNYGFNLSLWDRFFGTYVAQPELGHDAMQIGLPQFQSGKPDSLKDLLKLPFLNDR